MEESNSKKILDILKTGGSLSSNTTKKYKDPKVEPLRKIYEFLIKDRDEKDKRSQEVRRIKKESDFENQLQTEKESTVTDVSAVKDTETKKESGFLGALPLLGIVSVGIGMFVFSDEIKEKIEELKKYFEESTWMDEFNKLQELFNFDDLLGVFGIEEVPESITKASEIADFDASDLSRLTEGGVTQLGEEEFKQIQAQHKELEGKSYTDIEANLAAQAFKAKDIQQQLGTTDLAQTYAAEKIGVESTKRLYQAPETAIAADVLPEMAVSQRDIFYDESGKARTVGQVRERFAQQVSQRPTGDVEEILATIRDRESSNNYRQQASGSSASGAYQFIDDTWQTLSKTVPGAEQYQHAKDAPPQIQDAVARKYVQDILKKSGGDVTAVPRVWYTGNLQGKMSAKALAANKGYTVDRYVQHWMQDYRKISGKGGGMGPSYSTGLISTQVSPIPPELMAATSMGGNVGGLQFAPGVDTNIGAAISGKMRVIQNVFGRKLTITSGFRSPERNARVGGAKNSAHLRGNAIDISTQGMSTEDKVKLIQIASAIGIGGIGAYSSGGIHFDVEGRRGWGDGFTSKGIPNWAQGVIGEHIQGKYLGSLKNVQPIEQSSNALLGQNNTIPPTQIPVKQKSETKGSGTVIITQQNQNITSIVRKKDDSSSSSFKDIRPQDVLNSGIRGY